MRMGTGEVKLGQIRLWISRKRYSAQLLTQLVRNTPDRSLPGVTGLQSKANPSSLCPLKTCKGAWRTTLLLPVLILGSDIANEFKCALTSQTCKRKTMHNFNYYTENITNSCRCSMFNMAKQLDVY